MEAKWIQTPAESSCAELIDTGAWSGPNRKWVTPLSDSNTFGETNRIQLHCVNQKLKNFAEDVPDEKKGFSLLPVDSFR